MSYAYWTVRQLPEGNAHSNTHPAFARSYKLGPRWPSGQGAVNVARSRGYTNL